MVSGCYCKEVYRYPHNITYPYSICITIPYGGLISCAKFREKRKLPSEINFVVLNFMPKAFAVNYS